MLKERSGERLNSELTHHGIKDQKWGLRRFQNPDGSLTPAGRERYGVGKARDAADSDAGSTSSKGSANKASDKSRQHVSEMSDDKLRSRINRLNMEEQYSNLLDRQKTRETSFAKELLVKAGKDFAEQSARKIVSKIVNKIFAEKIEKDNFDIDKYKDADVYTMDASTIKKVADWYTQAGIIQTQRDRIGTSAPKSTNQTSQPSSQHVTTRIEKERAKRDKKQYKWLG